MRLATIFSLHRHLVMPWSRLRVLQRHLCCSSPSPISLPSSPTIRSLTSDTRPASAILQNTLKVVKEITESAGNHPTDAPTTVMNNYISFNDEERREFLTTLATDFQCDHDDVMQSITSLKLSSPAGVHHRQQQKLRESLICPYEVLFRDIGSVDGGVKFLVDMRKDLISVTRKTDVSDDLSALHAMNHNLKELLALWFGVGFLTVERVTWKSPCDLLEKVANYEAVHPVRNVTDLRVRVGAYRRCYAFLHPSMPDEPVVILHVALADGISDRLQAIVRHPSLSNESDFSINLRSHEDLSSFNSAIFYSITSTQPGLKGIDLGNYLIKSVVKLLLSEFPHLTQFSSLSPIPGFRDWLFTEINSYVGGSKSEALLTDKQISVLSSALKCSGDDIAVLGALKRTLQDGAWRKDSLLANALHDTMMNLCARYLYKEKHRNMALNSVANFHLRNGATLWRINWLANTTAKGLSESCGIMVNYRYYLDKTSINSEQYTKNYIIDIDPQVLQLLSL